MRTGKRVGSAASRGLAAVLLVLALGVTGCARRSAVPPAEARPFDEHAVAEQDIAVALREAQTTRRRVLLVFGANWCGDSRAMYGRLTADPVVAPVVRDHYVMVLVDVGPRHGPKWDAAVVQQYGRPFAGRGIPALVVLDADGRQLTTQASNPLRDSDHRHPRKVRRFLEAWVAPVAR